VLSLDHRLRELYIIWNKGLSSKPDFPRCVGLWNKELSSELEDPLRRREIDFGIRSLALSQRIYRSIF